MSTHALNEHSCLFIIMAKVSPLLCPQSVFTEHAKLSYHFKQKLKIKKYRNRLFDSRCFGKDPLSSYREGLCCLGKDFSVLFILGYESAINWKTPKLPWTSPSSAKLQTKWQYKNQNCHFAKPDSCALHHGPRGPCFSTVSQCQTIGVRQCQNTLLA